MFESTLFLQLSHDRVRVDPKSKKNNPNSKPVNSLPLLLFEILVLGLGIRSANVVPFLWFGLGLG